jgi:hypothetical protein
MVGRGKITIVLFGALSLCAAVHADMVPLSSGSPGCQQSPRASIPADPQLPGSFGPYAGFTGFPDLGTLPAGFPTQPQAEAGPGSATKPARILTDRQNSVSLCLYALLSVGLCRSAPLVRKFHFGGIPDWYHSGGPYQIGHSFVISPDCILSAPTHCFIQPDSTAGTERDLPECPQGIVISLWRESQFTSIVLASRGPPYMS